MTAVEASRRDRAVKRALVERASETLLAWAHYYLACNQDQLIAPFDEDPVEAISALRCQLALAEAATRRVRHLLALGTGVACERALDGEGDASV